MREAYLEHLTDRDLTFLARALAPAGDVGTTVRELRQNAVALERALGNPHVHRALFSAPGRDPLLGASPFLLFALCVNRAAEDLRQTRSLQEWVGPRQRVPLLDVATLRDFLQEPGHRVFLAELLASYTRVASGAFWLRSERGWRRQRFSELDPVRLARLAAMAPEPERPGILRRLGDLALFLTGVFPEHSAERALGPLDVQRLARVGALAHTLSSDAGGLALLEELGRRSYLAACATAASATASLRIVESVAHRFRDARRVLNYVTERYIFVHRTHWFAGPAA
jgi:hypothetical protein